MFKENVGSWRLADVILVEITKVNSVEFTFSLAKKIIKTKRVEAKADTEKQKQTKYFLMYHDTNICAM